jgi:hypothetical protein
MAAATTYLMDPTVTLSQTTGTVVTSYDITDQVSAITINQTATVLKKTTFGNTWHRNSRGLKSGTIKIDFYVDFDANGMFEIMKILWEHTDPIVEFSIAEATGAGRAAVSGAFVMSEMPSFDGAVDEYNVASLTFTLDGPVTNTKRT